MLSSLKLHCVDCPYDKRDYDLNKFVEHYADIHLGGFHIYKCPACDTRFATVYLAAHHMISCWSSAPVQTYTRPLDAYDFSEYQSLKKAVDVALTDAIDLCITERGSSRERLSACHTDSNTNGFCDSPIRIPNDVEHNRLSLDNIIPDDTSRNPQWGDSDSPPMRSTPARAPLLGHRPISNRPEPDYKIPSRNGVRRFEERDRDRERDRDNERRRSRERSPRNRSPLRRRPRSRSRDRERRRSRSPRDRKAKERGRAENWRGGDSARRDANDGARGTAMAPRPVPPPLLNIALPPTPSLDDYGYPRHELPSLMSMQPYRNPAPYVAVAPEPQPVPFNSRRGRGVPKLVGPMSTANMSVFHEKTSDTDVVLEIEAAKETVKMHFNTEFLSEKSSYFKKLFQSTEFVTSAEKKMTLHRPLVPFVDVMNLLHNKRLPWRIRCKDYFHMHNLHRIYKAIKEATELGIPSMRDVLARDLFLSRCNLLSDVSECTSCIERVVLALHFKLPIPENLKFSPVTCFKWITDCEELSCAPELNMTGEVTRYLKQFVGDLQLPGLFQH